MKKFLFLIVLLTLFSMTVIAGTVTFDPEPPTEINCTQGIICYYDFNATSTDITESLNYTLDTNPFSQHINPSTGVLNFTPTNDDVGENPLVFAIAKETQGGGGYAIAFINWTIINVNDPPNITSNYPLELVNLTVKENSSMYFNITAEDIDLIYNDSLNYTWLVDGIENRTLLNFTRVNDTQSFANYNPDYLSSKNYSRNITARAYDKDGLYDEVSWFVNVTNVNRLIIFNQSVPNATWFEDTNNFDYWDLDNSFYDNDTDDYPLQYNYIQISGSGRITVDITENSIDNHTVSYYPDGNFSGTETIQFSAFDGYNYTYGNNVTLTVINVNDAPVITAEDKIAYTNSGLFTYDLPVSDPDGPSLNCEDDTTLFDVFPSDGNCRVSFTPQASQIGTHLITITANDSYNSTEAWDSVVFNLTIKANSAPVLNKTIDNVSMNEGDTVIIPINATDVDTIDKINFSISSNPTPTNTDLFKVVTLDDNYTFATGRITITAGPYDPGNYTLTIIACDDKGACDSYPINVEILQIEHPPELDMILDQKIKINTTYNLTITATDLDSQELTFSINETNLTLTPITITNTAHSGTDDSAIIHFVPNSSDLGIHWLNISVQDPTSLVDWQIVMINITVNEPPTIQPIGNLTAQEDFYFNYTAMASDPNPQDIGNLTFYDNTTLFDIESSTGLIEFTPDYLQVGNYSILITVSDGDLNTSVEFNLTINETNDPPYFDPPLNEYYIDLTNTSTIWNSSIFEKNETIIYIDAVDEENDFHGDPLWFDVEFINFTNASGDTVTTNITLFNISNFDLNTAILNFTANNSDVGLYIVNFSVRDNFTGGQITWEIVNITVFNVNDNPKIVDYFPPSTTFPMYENETQMMNVSASDVDYLDELNYSWFVDGADQGVYNRTFHYTPDFLSSGLRNVTVVVTDLANGTNSTNWIVNVTNVNRPPWFGKIHHWRKSDFIAGTPSNINISGDDRTGGSLELAFNGSDYKDFGSFTSWIIDMQDANIYFNILELEWIATIPNSSDLQFRTRVANSTSVLALRNWSAPLTVPGTDISGGNGRYVQYLADFDSTTDNLQSPEVSSVTVNYEIADFSVPQNGLYAWVLLENYFKDYDTDDVLLFNVTYVDNNPDVAIIVDPSPPYRVLINSTLNPAFVGTEEIFFTVSDGYNTTVSNNIIITINETEQQSSASSGGGGGGGGGGSPRPIPQFIEKEVPKPVAFKLLTPGIVTTYENDTVKIPINLQNGGNFTLNEIYLTAETDNPEVEFEFSDNYFDMIKPGSVEFTTLTLKAFKTQPSYEIVVYANVTDPKYSDSAKILVNSLIKGERNETKLNTKIAFAEDLLRANAECLELNEFLSRARSAIANQQYTQAAMLIDSTIEGCKYLIAPRVAVEESPEILGFPKETMLIFMGVLISTIIATLAITYGRYKTKKAKGTIKRL